MSREEKGKNRVIGEIVNDIIGKEFQYGVACLDPESVNEDGELEVVHQAIYNHFPSQEDLDALREELRNDKDFALGDVVDRLLIKHMPKKMTEELLSHAKEMKKIEGE